MSSPFPPIMARGAARTGEAGFTLLEVLVAFVIAALALGVLFEGAVGGVRATRIADRTQEALSRAQSHLATVGHGIRLAPTTQEGSDGSGFRWSLRIRAIRSATTGTPAPAGIGAATGVATGAGGTAAGTRIVLYAVQVTEGWTDAEPGGDRHRSVTLHTERLGSTSADGT